MKKTILLFILVFALFGCKKDEVNEFPFNSLIFSYAGLHHDNSVKFTNSDTVFLQRRFPEPTENFYAIIQNDEKIKLNKYLQSLNLKKFKSVYAQENLCDGESYLINVSNNGKNKLIFIYGHIAPEELYNFVDSLGTFKKNLKFSPTKQIINFGDLTYILPPPPPPSLRKE
ncbi:hypothetical protein IRZ71_12285 [Flavobacterium sp. ANB]|uniref:hypothetical protein n=1 Tax=unclassified Flavobacterium TaxID=196869 RepID=UPI0012B9AD0E|nr:MULTISPECIES: hypothetical protein [unclassified Flavobacterium]MBF4517132.1 hypothetical protein [Flavobacterium sp. ANB]MTD71869.1 hypothetical protein [Flavobacterium sp. LC2016-13]